MSASVARRSSADAYRIVGAIRVTKVSKLLGLLRITVIEVIRIIRVIRGAMMLIRRIIRT